MMMMMMMISQLVTSICSWYEFDDFEYPKFFEIVLLKKICKISGILSINSAVQFVVVLVGDSSATQQLFRNGATLKNRTRFSMTSTSTEVHNCRHIGNDITLTPIKITIDGHWCKGWFTLYKLSKQLPPSELRFEFAQSTPHLHTPDTPFPPAKKNANWTYPSQETIPIHVQS